MRGLLIDFFAHRTLHIHRDVRRSEHLRKIKQNSPSGFEIDQWRRYIFRLVLSCLH